MKIGEIMNIFIHTGPVIQKVSLYFQPTGGSIMQSTCKTVLAYLCDGVHVLV